jgi:hypothetical protein
MIGRIAGASMAALVLVSGCTLPPPEAPGPTCEALFQQYDYYSQLAPVAQYRDEGSNITPGNLGRPTGQLISNGCLTTNSDLTGLEQLGAKLGFRQPTNSGTSIKPTALQVGVLTSITDVTRATVFFQNLGYQTRTIGAEGLGRRLYIGPFTSSGAMQEAVDTARSAGFIAPYPSKIFRFW